jgi:hypothetical protein
MGVQIQRFGDCFCLTVCPDEKGIFSAENFSMERIKRNSFPSMIFDI